jgi:hypothetical protein
MLMSGTALGASPVITTSSLPPGQVGVAYAATLTATGGQPPLSWRLTGGALPAGLTFASAGVLSGRPTANAAGATLTFAVTDSSTPAQHESVTLKLNLSPTNITVATSPRRVGLTLTQKLSFTATTNDYAGVAWSVSPAGGSFSAARSASGVAVTFTAPSSAGVYTVTARSVTNSSASAVVTVGVTGLAGVYTYHQDPARNGANTQEHALTPTNVNTATFGKLFSCAVDGAVYAEPLWVANLTVNGTPPPHNVVFVATAHDSLYAFDADHSPCLQLWHVSLIDTAHGAAPGEVTVPAGPKNHEVGKGDGDIEPEVGVIGTPVIDPVSGILYVVSKSMNAAASSFYQRLHAIDIKTGKEKTGSPIEIVASYPGTGEGGASVTFSPRQQNQRAGLALVNGTVYIAWGSHEDSYPWWGWMMGYTYNGTALEQSSVLNVVPNNLPGGGGGGIWMGGGAPGADVNGNLYVITGNGGFNVAKGNYGDSFLQLTGALRVTSYFTPSDQLLEAANDIDFGSGGAAMVLNLASAAGMPRHLVIGGGKEGLLVLLNGDNMGGNSNTNAGARQILHVNGEIFGTSAFWNDTLYLAPVGGPMLAYAFDPSSEKFTPTAGPVPTSQSSTVFGFPGATPTVSASGAATNGIVWALNNSSYCTPGGPPQPGCGPAVLHAYEASNLATELWNSSRVADAAGHAVKFTVPTVANGKVYVGTRGNNAGGAFGSTSVSGELDVYGLKP